MDDIFAATDLSRVFLKQRLHHDLIDIENWNVSALDMEKKHGRSQPWGKLVKVDTQSEVLLVNRECTVGRRKGKITIPHSDTNTFTSTYRGVEKLSYHIVG